MSDQKTADPTSSSRQVRAELVLATAAVLFGLTAIFAKLASVRLGGSQIALVRFSIGALPLLFASRYRDFTGQVKRWDLLLYRGLFGGFAVLCFFLAIARIPAGVASLLNCTSPIFAVIFAWLFLGEKVSFRVLPPALLAAAGVALVISGRIGGEAGRMQGNLWEFLALASAVLAGAALVAVRAARRTEGSWAIFVSFSLVGILVTAPRGVLGWIWPTWAEWFYLLMVGVLSLVGQLLLTWAFRWVDNLRAGVIGQISVVVSMFLGVVILDDQLSTAQLLGSLLTLAGVIGVIAQGAPSTPAPSGTRRAL